MDSTQIDETNKFITLNNKCLSQKVDIYKYHPKTWSELKNAIWKEIKEYGFNCDLNCVDVHDITDMSFMFMGSNFNGDISKWDVSNVSDMHGMFCYSQFNGDISNWNVGKVTDMRFMFERSKFNGNIFEWNINKVAELRCMFNHSPLEKVYGVTPKFINNKLKK